MRFYLTLHTSGARVRSTRFYLTLQARSSSPPTARPPWSAPSRPSVRSSPRPVRSASSGRRTRSASRSLRATHLAHLPERPLEQGQASGLALLRCGAQEARRGRRRSLPPSADASPQRLSGLREKKRDTLHAICISVISSAGTALRVPSSASF